MMDVQEQHIALPFNAGVDTKTDPKLVQAPMLTRLENAIFTRGGSLQKRQGYLHLSNLVSDGAAIETGAALATFNDELLLFNDKTAYSYSSTNDNWLSRSTSLSIKSTKRAIIHNEAEQTSPDMARIGNIAVVAWNDSTGGVRASVLDLETGVYTVSNISLTGTGVNPRCLAIGQHLFVLYVVGTELRLRRLSAGIPTSFDSEMTLVTNLAASKLYDAISRTASGLFAYSTSGAAIRVAYITENGFLGTSANGFPDAVTIADDATHALTVAADLNGLLFVGYYNNTTGTRAFARNSDLTSSFAPVTLASSVAAVVRNITAVDVGDHMQWIWETTHATSTKHFLTTNTLSYAGSPGTASILRRSVGLASKAWTYNGLALVLAAFDSALQSTYFTIAHDGTVTGRHLTALGGGLTEISQLPNVFSSGSGQFSAVLCETGRLRSDNDAIFSLRGIALLTEDFENVNRFGSAQLGQNLHFAGASVQAYDGSQFTEHGFHLFPEDASATPSGSGGTITSGTYTYNVCYEWTDVQGQLHRSIPGVIADVTVTGPTGSVAITIPTLRLTTKLGVRVVVYRTTAADASVFYRITSITSPVLNDPTVDSVMVSDIYPDTTIQSHDLLYTVGGVLENDPPPPCSVIVASKNRLFAINDEDGGIWYTKPHVIGEGASWSAAQQIVREGIKPTALATMDDKVIVFEASRIYAFAGDGPNVLGQNNTFSSIELVNTDVGCDSAPSVIRTSDGIMFKSHKGIYMLDRSLQLSYVGAPVEVYNDDEITGATLLGDANQVRFTARSGVALVYDLYFRQWSVFTNHLAASAALWKNTYVFLSPVGIVSRETSDAFLDNGVSYSLVVQTAWINLAQLQGFQRVRRLALLGDLASSHTLSVDIGYDYSDFYTDQLLFVTDDVLPLTPFGDSTPFGSDTVYGSVEDGVYQFRAVMPRQKCQSVRFLFQDTGGSGRSYSLSGLDLLLGVKRGLAKLRSAKSL